MSERITLTGSEASDSESNSEKDSSDSKTSGKGRGGRGLGSLAALTTGRGPEAKSDTTKSEVAEKSKPILDRIFGVKDSPEEPTKTAEISGAKPTAVEATPEAQSPAGKAEEDIVQALAGEGEINLRDLSKVPESRDEAIVKQAVEEVVSQQAAEVGVVEVSSEVSDELENQAKTEPDEQLEKVPDITTAEAIETPEPEEEEEPVRPTAATTASSSSSSAPSTSTAAPMTAGSSGGSSGRPPVPPTLPGPPLMPPGPSPRRRTPNQAYYPNQSYGPNTYTTPPAANTILSPLTPNVLNPTTIEDAQEYAYRRGRNRGLVAGLIVGGGIEHIRHKRREKRMERKFAVERKDQGKKIENIRWDQIRETEAAKIREANAEKYRPIERATPVIRPEAGRIAQAQSAAEVVRQKVEIQTEIEKKLEAERKDTTRIISKAEQTEQERLHEQLELAQGHHIERSAWHNIEVDSHGKAVQETAFEYGHEYYKERGHETGPKTKQQVDTAAGEVALVAAALGGSGSGSSRDSIQGSSTQPHGTISVQTQPGVPHKQQSFLKTVTTPPTTPAGTVGWFVALVVILAVLLIVVF